MTIQDRIQNELIAIEEKENLTILLAVESGSRAWGFPSPDSDYDVRFLYIRPKEHYLSLEKHKDVYELPLDDVLDINGWDFDKTLRLLRSSNPTLFEWISSPIIYRKHPAFDELMKSAYDYFLSKPGMYHYLNMADGNYREFLKTDMVKLKKYFYVLRPTLACRHILQNGTPPPMLFKKLVETQLDKKLIPEIEDLLLLKEKTSEMGLAPRRQLINDYIEESLVYLKSEIEKQSTKNKKPWSSLNSIFLKALEVEKQIISNPMISSTGITNDSSNDDKVELFLTLFRGRNDVYAKRWESRDKQKSGYSPVCRNEWVPGLCIKPKDKCADCKHREFIQFDKQVITRHFQGKEIIGIYPMLLDDTCFFLVIDFDDAGWQNDITAIRLVCNQYRIPIAVERSRSGNGAHVWLFFEEAIAASLARKLGSAIITNAMDERYDLRFTSYDRLFPSQDTLPNDGVGNLIALPLQRKSRDDNNTVFIDENFTPYLDQWAFLDTIKHISSADVQNIIKNLTKSGELGSLYRLDEDEDNDTPWKKRSSSAALNKMDFPSVLQIVEANMIFVDKEGVSQRALNRIKRFAAFSNPEFYKAQAMRLKTWDKPRIISISDETGKYLCLPRGCKNDVLNMLDDLDVEMSWQDERNHGNPINVEFNGVLRDEQALALEQLSINDIGILSATTAFGKTVVSAAMIAKLKVNVLILVNRQPLLDQWKQRLKEFLIINETLPEPEKKRGRKKELDIIGQLGGGKNTLTGIIDIAIIQSLVRGDEVKDIVKNYGLVIVDECHHISAVSFEKVLKEINAKYVYGLTATPKRQDGHQPIIYMHCGQIRYRDDAKVQAERRPFDHFVIPRFTSFRIPIEKDDTPMQIQELYNEICRNETRNNMIINDVLRAVAEGRNPLVLTERKAHIELLENELKSKFPYVITLVGGQSAKSRRLLIEKVESIPSDQPFIIVATGKYVGEGFDVPRLDTLFLAMPFAWQGTLAQYAGRLHRLHDDKHEVQVYDYVDVHVAVLDRMYAKRVKGYSLIGYKTKCDSEFPDAGNIIFDSSNFMSVFTKDLLSAKKNVIVASPYLSKTRLSKMMDTFGKIIISGAELTVATRPVDEYAEKDRFRIIQMHEMLKKQGVSILEQPKLHQKFAVIDGRTSWYGSINLLSFGSSEEGIMRLESKGVAAELLKAL